MTIQYYNKYFQNKCCDQTWGTTILTLQPATCILTHNLQSLFLSHSTKYICPSCHVSYIMCCSNMRFSWQTAVFISHVVLLLDTVSLFDLQFILLKIWRMFWKLCTNVKFYLMEIKSDISKIFKSPLCYH